MDNLQGQLSVNGVGEYLNLGEQAQEALVKAFGQTMVNCDDPPTRAKIQSILAPFMAPAEAVPLQVPVVGPTPVDDAGAILALLPKKERTWAMYTKLQTKRNRQTTAEFKRVKKHKIEMDALEVKRAQSLEAVEVKKAQALEDVRLDGLKKELELRKQLQAILAPTNAAVAPINAVVPPPPSHAPVAYDDVSEVKAIAKGEAGGCSTVGLPAIPALCFSVPIDATQAKVFLDVLGAAMKSQSIPKKIRDQKRVVKHWGEIASILAMAGSCLDLFPDNETYHKKALAQILCFIGNFQDLVDAAKASYRSPTIKNKLKGYTTAIQQFFAKYEQ